MFGTKQIVISHASGSVNPSESTPSTIKGFLSKHCADHPNTWDEHLPALSFAFNVTHSEPTKNTPYFQMFNRNPCLLEWPPEVGGENTSVFARIVAAVREADVVLEDKTPSAGQVSLYRKSSVKPYRRGVMFKISACGHVHVCGHDIPLSKKKKKI